MISSLNKKGLRADEIHHRLEVQFQGFLWGASRWCAEARCHTTRSRLETPTIVHLHTQILVKLRKNCFGPGDRLGACWTDLYSVDLITSRRAILPGLCDHIFRSESLPREEKLPYSLNPSSLGQPRIHVSKLATKSCEENDIVPVPRPASGLDVTETDSD
jgi:hypothetical protein